MPASKVREQDFDLHVWYSTIPMTDDVYLGLQAQNLARVEMSVVRLWEREVLDEQEIDPGSYQGPKYRELLALSQMWVFGVYEFLRTWRQRARLLKDFENKYNRMSTAAERETYLEDVVGRTRDKAHLATRFPVYYPDHVGKIADPAFMLSVRSYYDETEELWLRLSAVRMPAAKHELPGKKGQGTLIADAPGIGLPERATGSILWQVFCDDKLVAISRRDLADAFFGILGWHEDIETALSLANEAKARRKRLARQGGGRSSKAAAAGPDPYFRTQREVFDDDRPLSASVAKGPRDAIRSSRPPSAPVAQSPRTPIVSREKKAATLKYSPSEPGSPGPPPYFVREPGLARVDERSTASPKLRYPKNRKN